MSGDESTPRFSPLGQSPPTGDGNEEWDDPAGSLSYDANCCQEMPTSVIPTDTETTLLAESTADVLIQAALHDEAQKRLWLRTIIPLLQLRSHDSDPSGRVQLAYDLMHIAACERTSRLLRSDLPAENA